ncbi:MAG: GGDEF domain-containing protein [Nitrospirae bacterium]|nr:GGDEF domain-containing protein [Nitrospirota bacterium]
MSFLFRDMTKEEILEEELKELRPKVDVYLKTIKALFFFLKEFSSDADGVPSDEFKRTIDGLGAMFAPGEKAKDAGKAFEKSKDAILGFIKKEKDYFANKEAEYKNIIEILISGFSILSADNIKFTSNMFDVTAILEEISNLKDILDIKSGLVKGISHMKKTIGDKQARDDQHISAVSKQTQHMKIDLAKSRDMYLVDELTGAYKRFAFDTYLKNLIERSAVTKTQFAVAVVELDNFYEIHKTHGEQISGRAFSVLGEGCKKQLRKDDYLCRFEENSFSMVLLETSLRHALKTASTICKEVSGQPYAFVYNNVKSTLKLTVASGVGTLRKGDTADVIMKRTLSALNLAKKQGGCTAIGEDAL